MKTFFGLLFAASIVGSFFLGCSVRMFNIGDENSVTNRVDSLGYYDNDYRKRNQAEEVTIEDFTKGKDN